MISIQSKPTGSWFAHGKNDKLWLDRLIVEREDGEILDLVLDKDAVVTTLEDSSNNNRAE